MRMQARYRVLSSLARLPLLQLAMQPDLMLALPPIILWLANEGCTYQPYRRGTSGQLSVQRSLDLGALQVNLCAGKGGS